MGVTALEPGQLCWRCDPADLGFESTEDLDGITGLVGQNRAEESLRFGLGMRRAGYNMYALGPQGLHKHTLVRRYLGDAAGGCEVPPDRCYVNNFDEPHRPYVLKLPAGRGRAFKRDTDNLVDEARDALRTAFESQEYRTRRQMIHQEVQERQENAVSEVEEEARQRNIALQRTPQGFAFAPMREGKVLSGEDFHNLSEAEQRRVQQDVEHLQNRLQQALQNMPQWVKEAREKVRQLNEEAASHAVGHLVENLKRAYDPLESVQNHLERVKRDLIENAETILTAAQQEQQGGQQQAPANHRGEHLMRRYRTNLLVDNGDRESAPVVYEDDPAYERLVGRIEHRAEMGALTTDFHLIRAGALHRANGGYLMLDARQVLTKPMAWEGLKRALRARQIRIEPPYQALGLFSTVSLEPEPIPLDVKIVLVGERMLYFMLSELDPDFAELFKVAVDFDERADLTADNRRLYARMIASMIRREQLAPFGADAVARVMEQAVRWAGDQDKLSVEVESVADLLREADFQRRRAGATQVAAEEVDAALDARDRRLGRVRERTQEAIERDTLLIDSQGWQTAQINALTVMALGGYSFGRPTRVTARAGLGPGRVVDIEREVELGGPVHAKGVLILSGFLQARFARERPLSLAASLVFEQSYSGVEGDSASLAELVALLSAIAELPLRQDLAVTGSVNQHGRVQPIGGANEKIEGFFDVCRARGLTGEQGVVVPASNVRHLMLHRRVRDAAGRGAFHVHSVETVDDALALFTGYPAGEPDGDGRYPAGSVNGMVQAALDTLADRRSAFGLSGRAGGGSPDGQG